MGRYEQWKVQLQEEREGVRKEVGNYVSQSIDSMLQHDAFNEILKMTT